MITPNGRFKTCTRLCLSMSDFHPESWNPMWSVGTILMGLYSFMMEETATYGSIETSPAFRRKCAEESLGFNVQNSVFCELFPELLEKYNEEFKRKQELASIPIGSLTTSTAISSPISVTGRDNHNNVPGGGDGVTSWAAMLGMLAAIIACTWAILNLL